jgi:hypothetical protein
MPLTDEEMAELAATMEERFNALFGEKLNGAIQCPIGRHDDLSAT